MGVLCEDCAGDVRAPATLSPEQVVLHGANPTAAALIDPWGRPHVLDAPTPIGRGIEPLGLAIYESSISRRHAELVCEGDHWAVRDLGSANGTYVDDLRITRAVFVRDTACLRFGRVRMYLLVDASALPQPARSRSISDTAPRAVRREHARATTTELPPQTLRLATFEVQVPTGGGSGYLVVDGKRIQLTAPQLELISILAERMLGDEGKPEELRGFVHGRELTRLSFDTVKPTEDHLRHLIGRVRAALMRAEIGDLIESRYGRGYRLRVVPRFERAPSVERRG